jgi:DNA repair protein RecN (Recombination protein N)
MLNFLQIRNYAIVESLELEFGEGFTCITGETGAGKSILVGALGLLCGNRADSSAVRQDTEKAELSAGFELEADSPALAWLREADLDDDSSCLLRRVVHANGRSRAWINGTAATLQQVAELGRYLVEIHGQNEHLALVRSDEQFRLLDGAGTYDADLQETRTRYFSWHELEMEKQALLAQAPLDSGDIGLLTYQAEELETSMLPAAEFSAMEKEHRKLARGSEIVAALESVLEILHGDRTGAGAGLHRAAGELEVHAALDSEIETAMTLLREAAINCDEAGAAVQSALSRMDLGPERLAELERALGAQHDLARKHRVEPEELEQVLADLRRRLELAGAQEIRLKGIDAELDDALGAYKAAADRLHARRVERARVLSRDVTALMQELGMEGGRFEIDVSPNPENTPSPRGGDRLELRVSANRGIEPGPLRKVASGGELSRISLAVKIVARDRHGGTTQVFDEVDAGIGGATASTVGSLIRKLSANGQALCVTHLAQVAVFAATQVRVDKSSGKREAAVITTVLGENDRVDEVARMLGGQLSQQSRAHALELLQEAVAPRH